MIRQELIEQALDKMDYSDLFDVWNAYCNDTCNYENALHYMDDFDHEFINTFLDMDALGIIRKVKDDFYDFNPDADYFRGDDEYCLESVDDILDVVDISELAEYIDRNDKSFGFDVLEEALSGYRDKVVEVLNNLRLEDLVNIYNSYAEQIGDVHVHPMSDFDEVNRFLTPRDIALRIHNGNFNPYNAYWWYQDDENGNYESGTFVNDLPIDVDGIADYMIEHDTDFDNPVLKEALSDIA